MDLYTINYTKITNGYHKLIDTIESCETLDQLGGASNLADNWILMVNYYCGRVKKDFKNIHRNHDADKLADAVNPMIEDIKNLFAQINAEIVGEPYDYAKEPIRIKSLQEISHEYDVLENDDEAE